MPRKSKDGRVAVLAGAISGGIEATATFPTEYIKTQLQLSNNLGQGRPQYNGFMHCASHTVRTQGVLGLYRGLAPLVGGAIPKAAVRFGAFEFYRRQLTSNTTESGTTSALKNLAAGMCAGVTEAILVVTPMETLKVKLIDTNAGFVRGTTELVRKHGIRSIYQGLTPTIAKQASNQGIRFFFFTEFKNFFASPDGNLSPILTFGGGMFAGLMSVLGNNPIDVVKTRMQGMDAARYANSWDCAKQIVRKEGIRAFYKGAGARMGRVVPGQGIIFMTYETITSILEGLILKN